MRCGICVDGKWLRSQGDVLGLSFPVGFSVDTFFDLHLTMGSQFFMTM